MAQLKDSIVSGNLRITGKTLTDTMQATIIRAPSTSGGTSYSAGTSGQILRSNGTSSYWGGLAASDIPSLNYVPNTSAGVSAALNLLTAGSSNPTLNDYYISQFAGGGTTTTTYHRRPISALWNTFKALITVATTGSGNAITSVSIADDGNNRKITFTKGNTFSTTDQNVKQGKTETTDFRPIVLGVTHSSDPTALTPSTEPEPSQVYVNTQIYAKPSTGQLFANGFRTNANSNGFFLVDSANNTFAGMYAGDNFWIGAVNSSNARHNGGTYISSGYTGTLPTTAGETLTGNSSIYVSVPTYTATDASSGTWSHNAYPVYHSGNHSSPSVTAVTTSGLLKITHDSHGHITASTVATGSDLPSHSHTLSMATDSGTSSISLAANTKYKLTAGGSTYVFTTPSDNDTKVTSSANHYSPSTVSGQDKSASASGATAAWSIDVVKGVTLNTDGKGHVTGISVTSGKIPGNPNRVADGTANQMAYYSAATTVSSSPAIYYKTANSTAATPAERKILGIYGETYGNAENMISGTAGLFSYGDGGPQIDFNVSSTGSQAGALIYTANDLAAAGASWHFVSNQTDWNVTSKRFHARTSVSIGTNLPVTSHNLYVNGTASITGATTLGGRLTTTKPINDIITGSGTTAQDKGSGVSPRYFPAKWTFNTGHTATNGDIIVIKIPCAGSDYGVFISINNGTNYHPISISGATRLTTHFSSGYFISLIFKSDGGTNSVYPVAGGDSRVNVTGGAWYVVNYYDTGNTYDRNRYNAAIKAWGTKIIAGNIIVGINGLYHHLKEGTAFDITYPMLYLAADCNASTATSNTYDQINFTITTTQSITLTAYKPVYIKGTLSGTTFTPVSTTPLTQTVPSTDDGYVYMLLGNATSTTAVYLLDDHRIFAYKNGTFGELSVSKLSGTVGDSGLPVYLNNGTITACSNPSSGAWWDTSARKVPRIDASGVIELGKYCDFHATIESTNNYDIRLEASSTSNLILKSADEDGPNFVPSTTDKGSIGTSSLRWQEVNARSLDGNLRSAFVYDNASNFASYPWHKFAEMTIASANFDSTITFLISRTQSASDKIGILTVWIRTNSSKIFSKGYIHFNYHNSGLNPDDFVAVYTDTASTSCKVELYCKMIERYGGVIATVLKEHSRVDTIDSWTLTKYTASANGVASVPDGTGHLTMLSNKQEVLYETSGFAMANYNTVTFSKPVFGVYKLALLIIDQCEIQSDSYENAATYILPLDYIKSLGINPNPPYLTGTGWSTMNNTYVNYPGPEGVSWDVAVTYVSDTSLQFSRSGNISMATNHANVKIIGIM